MSRTLRDVPARAQALLPALEAALSGTGPAVCAVAAPRAGEAAGTTAGHRAVPEGAGLEGAVPEGAVPDDTVLVVRTSGSTGDPRAVALSGAALRASGDATAARTGGPGRWLLALPPEHVAGAQVLVRSVLAGTSPVVLPDGPFRAPALTEALARLTHAGPRYASLVPTQLVRVLDDPAATDALASLDAVLVGGAASAPDLLVRARAAGIRVVTTYGMSETCGGCVYDRRPLDGVGVRLSPTGRVLLSGPVLATGYVGRPDLDAVAFTEVDGVRHHVTNDVGELDASGALRVLGRADDVILTGGTNVAPAPVEALLATLPDVLEACVVGVPDPEWGRLVVAVLVLRPGAATPSRAQARDAVTGALPAAHAPHAVLTVPSLPLRGPGKIDRRAVAQLAADALERSPA